MRIKDISVENYRNLNSATITFDESCNFIVGENNLGKSNILNLLNIIFTRRGFVYDDFNDANLPITVNIRIKLTNDEIGHFEDLFDIDDYTYINIICKQVSPDDNMEFYHLETETYISPTLIKCLNFIYYDSLRNPISEINFDSSKGVGRFLSRMIKDYVSNTDINTNNLVDIEFTNDLLTNVNTKLEKIKSFKDHAIKAVLEGDVSLLFPKLISLQDARGGALSKCGYGIQFLLLVTLSILNKLQTISDQRGETGVFVNEDTGERSISVVLGLDEPEIHLHPYMQRSSLEKDSFPNWYGLCGRCKNGNDCNFVMTKDIEKSFFEELSVFYVAVTRAKKQVFFTASHKQLTNRGIFEKNYSCFMKLPGIEYIQTV